ncbi:MAG TPA: hypothetical protein VKU41_29355 [Polyangiaceae bacterium]|nr:hypothetical protein [Polyangiaceae bacterium]
MADRRYNEGIGVRAGDFELHPGIAGEVGYDSNWFMRTNNTGPLIANGAPAAPIVPAFTYRITPSLYLGTLGPQRREGDTTPQLPTVAFRLGLNGSYRGLIGLSSDASAPQNDPSRSNNVSVAADTRLDILPERPVGGSLSANYGRIIQPNTTTADPNLSFIRDELGAGAELAFQPGSGTLDYRLGYHFSDVLFEQSEGTPYDNTTHEGFIRGRWKFRPRTALMYDGSIRAISYANSQPASVVGLANSTPVRARIGLNGLITDRFAAMALVGWGASFYDTTIPQQPQYDSVIGNAELKWFLSASPGIASATDIGLALSSISIGYTRDFQNSYIGNFYGLDRGYLKFFYFFAGRALVTLEGGVAAIEYPNMFWGPGVTPALRHSAFTDTRADATLFGEYRFSSTVGVNATVRYTANFSSNQVPEGQGPTPFVIDMSWNRVEAFLGVRWFM